MLTGQIDVLEEALEENGNFPLDVDNVDVRIGTDANGYEWAVLINPASVTATLLPAESYTYDLNITIDDKWTFPVVFPPFVGYDKCVFNRYDPQIDNELQEIVEEAKKANIWAKITFKARKRIGTDGVMYFSITEIESYRYHRDYI